MALFSNLNDLQLAVRQEAERLSNGKFDASLPRFVASAEHRIFHGADAPLASPPLRIRTMTTTATLALVAGEVALPSDYLQVQRLQWDGLPRSNPTFEAPQSFFRNRYTDTSGSPVRYTIEGTKLYVSPLVSGDLTFVYYARPTELVDEDDTNAVLTGYPMVYFHATLVEAFSYLRNAAEMQKQYAAYLSLLGGLNRSQAAGRLGSSSPLAPRVPGPAGRY